MGGCLPPGAEFKFGLGTTKVVGTVGAKNGSQPPAETIIVVQKNHHQFVSLGSAEPGALPPLQGSRILTHPTAHVETIDGKGNFSVSMPTDVVSMEIWFIAPNRLTRVFRISRVLGMGRITYHASLPAAPDWRSHFYTYLEPQLQHLIVEKRYRLTDKDQISLGKWLTAQKLKLESRPPRSKRQPPRP